MYKTGNLEMWSQKRATGLKGNINKLLKKIVSVVSSLKKYSVLKTNKINVLPKEFLGFGISTCSSAVERNIKRCYNFEEYEHESYHNQMKPLFLLMRLFGTLPVKIRQSGAPTFTLFSFITAYTVCFWIVLAACSYINFSNRLTDYNNKTEELGPSIFLCLHIFAMFALPIVPVTASLDVKRVTQYMNQWVQFRRNFQKVTRNILIISIRGLCIRCVTTCCIGGIGTIWFHFSTPYVALKNMMPYISLAVLTSSLKFFWYCTYKSLEAANNSLTLCFKRDIVKKTDVSPVINEYRVLWLQLSQLVAKTGEALGKIFVLYNIVVLIVMVLSFYGCLSGIRIQKDAFFCIAFMSGACIIAIVPFYVLCNIADNISTKMRANMQEELQIIKSSNKDLETIQEVDIFLLTILTNPPIITVNGFAEANRGLFKAHLSTLVTYLVVLLQFDIGQLENKNHSNTTNNLR